jgi:hypothetical protein
MSNKGEPELDNFGEKIESYAEKIAGEAVCIFAKKMGLPPPSEAVLAEVKAKIAEIDNAWCQLAQAEAAHRAEEAREDNLSWLFDLT